MNSLNNYLLIKTASVLITGVNINEKKMPHGVYILVEGADNK